MPTKKKIYDMQYAKKNYKRVALEIKKDYFTEIIKPHCEYVGMPVNTFIKQAITEKIQRDGIDLPIDMYNP